jgi:uncharacterized protein YdaU (DUF1376 family)
MHFYQKNIGDFNNATRHLTRVERSLFSDAIELYYDTEKPLTNDINRLERLLLAHSEEEKVALKSVLDEFFTITDDGYFNKRCHEEIVKYHTYMESKSKAGKASAEQRAKQKSTGVEQVLNTASTKQNQEPLTNNKEESKPLADKPPKKSRNHCLPDDFIPNASHQSEADASGLDLQAELKGFKNHHVAKGSLMANWDAALHTWLVNAVKFKQPSRASPVPNTKQAARESYYSQMNEARERMVQDERNSTTDIAGEFQRVA